MLAQSCLGRLLRNPNQHVRARGGHAIEDRQMQDLLPERCNATLLPRMHSRRVSAGGASHLDSGSALRGGQVDVDLLKAMHFACEHHKSHSCFCQHCETGQKQPADETNCQLGVKSCWPLPVVSTSIVVCVECSHERLASSWEAVQGVL